MTIGILVLEIIIPASSSLKEKRFVVKGLKDRTRKKFNISIAETDYLDKWQRAELAIAIVSNQQSHVEESLQHVFQFLDNADQYEIISYRYEYC